MPYSRGDVVLVLFPDANLRTAKRRPALVIQADNLSTGLPQTIVAMITSNLARAGHPSRALVFHTSIAFTFCMASKSKGYVPCCRCCHVVVLPFSYRYLPQQTFNLSRTCGWVVRASFNQSHPRVKSPSNSSTRQISTSIP